MEKIDLHSAAKPEYFRKKIKFQCIVSGKSVMPYSIPKTVTITCKADSQSRGCAKCLILALKGLIELKPDIRFVGTQDSYFPVVLQKILGISCKFDYKVNEVYTVEELYIRPPLRVEEEENQFSSSRLAYYIGYDIPTNIEIEAQGYTCPEPKQQKTVHVITSFKSIKSDIEEFHMTRELRKDLTIFHPAEDTVDSIYDKLESLYEIYSHNITKIYHRFDLHMAVDLAFHSVLSFNLGNEHIHKGWADIMILGDTRCGKGFVAERLAKYYRLGDVVSGENVTLAGLIGGVQQISGRWILTWGKIPLNDKRLVIIDEAGEMDEILQKFSRVRSEGIAEITKIKTEMNYARTRLVFLANPKSRTVSSYTYGIEALPDVVPNSEDISRFDYVLIVANNEVSLQEINMVYEEKENPYSEYDNALVRWIWSRKPDQIIFSKEVLDRIMELSIKLGGIYSQTIPLIQGENIRVKLAKIALMIAARTFSSSKDGENIIVNMAHVEAAYVFFSMIYKKNASSYYYYSKIKKDLGTLKDVDNLEKYIKSYNGWESIIDYLTSNNYITASDMSDYINQPKDMVREIISTLLKHGCIQKKYQFYVKNQGFSTWLKKWRE